MTYEELAQPLNPSPIVAVIEHDNNNSGPVKPTTHPSIAGAENLAKNVEETSTSSLLNTEFLPKSSSLCNDDRDITTVAVSATIKPTTIEVAAGN